MEGAVATPLPSSWSSRTLSGRTEYHATHHTPLYLGACKYSRVLLSPFWQPCVTPAACDSWRSQTLAQICWSSHSEVMGILSCISHRGNWSTQRSFIQGSGAADNGEEGLGTPVIFLTSHPNIHEFSYWVLVSLNLWLPLITVLLKSQDTKPDL